jgi:hypothetical protein
MARVRTSVPIAQQATGRHLVVVRTGLTLDRRHRRDAQWQREECRLENALGAEERDTLALKREAGRK